MRAGSTFQTRKQVIAHMIGLMYEASNLDPSEYDEVHDRRDEVTQLAIAFDIPERLVSRLWARASELTRHPATRSVTA